MIKLKSLLQEKAPAGNFVRFGGLSPVKQKGFTTNPEESFHSPPARKGIYAFPKNYIDIFLLGGEYANPKNKNKANRFSYVKDKQGNKITNNHPEFDKLIDNPNYWDIEIGIKDGAVPDEDGDYDYDDKIHALIKRVHPKHFKHTGDIWHHLKEFVEPEEIIKERGSWVKTSMSTYLKAFKKNAHASKKEMRQNQTHYNDGKFDISKADVCKDGLKYFCRDHLEVFIERIK